MEVVKRDFIEDGCSAYWATDDCKLISAQTTLDLDCDDAFFEDTALNGILLSIKHASGMSQKVYQNSSFFQGATLAAK